MTPAAEFRDVTKAYGRRVVVQSLNLSVAPGSFTVIFGAPACGKSTLLRLLTGLEKPDSGSVWLRGQEMTKVAPGERNIGYVPQSFALYPHYSVFDNIAYPLSLLGYPKAQVKPVVERVAEQLKITHLLKKKPDQCSGGEKQRVAIARGTVKNTNIFVLDDPLTGLDFKLRERLFDDLRQMKDSLQAAFIYTTSDALEAMILAEDIMVLDGGKIIESGPLEATYEQPKHMRTMELLNFPEANMMPATLSGQRCKMPVGEFGATLNGATGGEIIVGVRPQDVLVNPDPDARLVRCPAEITLVEDLGGEMVVYLRVNETELTSVVRQSEGTTLTEGHGEIGIYPEQMLIYTKTDGRYIGRGAS